MHLMVRDAHVDAPEDGRFISLMLVFFLTTV